MNSPVQTVWFNLSLSLPVPDHLGLVLIKKMNGSLVTYRNIVLIRIPPTMTLKKLIFWQVVKISIHLSDLASCPVWFIQDQSSKPASLETKTSSPGIVCSSCLFWDRQGALILHSKYTILGIFWATVHGGRETKA